MELQPENICNPGQLLAQTVVKHQTPRLKIAENELKELMYLKNLFKKYYCCMVSNSCFLYFQRKATDIIGKINEAEQNFT